MATSSGWLPAYLRRFLPQNWRKSELEKLRTENEIHNAAMRTALKTRNLHSVGVGLDLMRDLKDQQLSTIDAVDTKAGFVLASSSVLTAVLAAWHQPLHSSALMVWLPFFAIGLYVCVVGLSATAYWIGSYLHVPPTELLKGSLIDQEPRVVQYKLLYTMAVAYERNERKLARKVSLVGWAYGLFCVQMAFVVLLVGIEVWP